MNNQTKNKSTMSLAALLHEANEFVKKGQHEAFLDYCTEDTRWVFIGERILSGKEEVRDYMKEFYREPPVFSVDTTVEDGRFLAVTGEITLKDQNGLARHYDYCDVWQFEDRKIAALKAYVVEKKS